MDNDTAPAHAPIDTDVVYALDRGVTVTEFLRVLEESGLDRRRPVDDPVIIADMLQHGNLMITARRNGELVGFARTMTDFTYVGYLSDLAVSTRFQRMGIGRRLIEETRRMMGPRSMLVLLAAPAAADYYPQLGFSRHPAAFLVRANEPLR